MYFGSAITGAGVDALVTGIRDLLPRSRGACDGTPAGRVFKVERGPSGEKVALVRMTSGILRVRDRVRLPAGEAKVTGLEVYDAGGTVARPEVEAGRIARVRGLAGARVGDVLGAPADAPVEHWFAPPTLETVVEPVRDEDRRALHTALTELAEQDPLIDLRQDDVRGELWVSMYGEVQKEVVAATLAADHGVEVTFRETTTICVERLVGTGEAFEIIDVEPNPFLATVGLRVAPAPVGAGVTIGLGVELGSMPSAFFNAIEETVHETLHQGLHGWDVPDCAVTITHTGYWPRQSHAHATFDASMSSTAGDFRNLTPLVLTEALRRAGTQVLRADAPLRPRGARRPGRRGAGRPRAAARCPARDRPARVDVRAGGGGARGRGAPAAAGGADADPRGGRADHRVRPLRAGARARPEPAAHGPQPARTARSTCCGSAGACNTFHLAG